MKKLLIVVDYQTDFVSGSLSCTQAQALEQPLFQAIKQHLAQGGFVLFTLDTHTEQYLHTREGQHLPIAHCIAGSQGHALYGQLSQWQQQPAEKMAFLEKPIYGAATLAQVVCQLCHGAPSHIELCGVATDICVISNAILAHTFFPEAQISLRQALCAGTSVENHQRALAILQTMGYHIL